MTGFGGLVPLSNTSERDSTSSSHETSSTIRGGCRYDRTTRNCRSVRVGGTILRSTNVQASVRHLLAIVVVASLPLAGCDSEGSRPADTQPQPRPTTSTVAVNAKLVRLYEARDRWNQANISKYQMSLIFSGRIGRIECQYDIDNGVSIFTAGPFRHEADTTVAANDPSAEQLCEKFAVLEDVYEHLESAVQGADEFDTASVAYEFRGVPVFIQYPGDPATDGGGNLEVSVAGRSA